MHPAPRTSRRTPKTFPWMALWMTALLLGPGLASAVEIHVRDNPTLAGGELAAAMDIPVSQIKLATTGNSSHVGKAAAIVGNDGLGLGLHFPTNGNSFAILSTGRAGAADNPNNSPRTTEILGRLNNAQGKDLVELFLTLSPPNNARCLAFDYAFYSEEFPERIDGVHNDTFTATIGAVFSFSLRTFTSVSVNNATFKGSTGTTYDGGTALLTAVAALQPADFPETEIVLSIEDLGDSLYDSAVFLDNFRWLTDPGCQVGPPPGPRDSDGDALLDAWETFGVDTNDDGAIDLDLPAMGADPKHKDIFVEADYMVLPSVYRSGVPVVVGHSHKPDKAALSMLVDAFDGAPVSNPDGMPGIHLHVDAGPDTLMDPVTGRKWGSWSEADPLEHDDELGSCQIVVDGRCGLYDWTEFDQIKRHRFSSSRAVAFHYVIFAHALGASRTSGLSRGILASDFIVSLGFLGASTAQAGTFMHELGHNLNLHHGGSDDLNYKPNYLSVMNYSFQTRGLILGGFFGRIDYSFEALPSLNELNLDERLGIGGSSAIAPYGTTYFCGGSENLVYNAQNPIDWNCNGSPFETGVATSINKDAVRTTLSGFNDWEHVVFKGGAVGQSGQAVEPPTQTEVDEITDEEAARLRRPFAVTVSGPGVVAQLAGTAQVYGFVVKNRGENTDTYRLAMTSELGWGAPVSLPATLALGPGQSATASILVTIPPGTLALTADELTVTATSVQTDQVTDSATMSPYVPENPPIANAGPDQRVECSSQRGTPVTLDGSASRAPSGGELVYVWTGPFPEGGGKVSGVRPTVTLPLGASTITLRVNDGIVDSYPDQVAVNVVDTIPPQISVSLTPKSLWPPDHKMQDVRAAVTATDICTPPVVALASVTSSEPDDAPGGGDGETKNDVQGATTGTADFLFSVRAERAGSGPGRTYTALYTATDSSGNQAQSQDQVKIPHSQEN